MTQRKTNKNKYFCDFLNFLNFYAFLDYNDSINDSILTKTLPPNLK